LPSAALHCHTTQMRISLMARNLLQEIGHALLHFYAVRCLNTSLYSYGGKDLHAHPRPLPLSLAKRYPLASTSHRGDSDVNRGCRRRSVSNDVKVSGARLISSATRFSSPPAYKKFHFFDCCLLPFTEAELDQSGFGQALLD